MHVSIIPRLPVLAIAALLLWSQAGVAQSGHAPRERVSINTGWRFKRGDPDSTMLDRTALDPWILPTANAYIKDAAKQHLRPLQEPEVSPAYAQPGFDDSQWENVALPHDWAIAGPFIESGDHGGMGRLPSAGVGWYRKQLTIAAGETGKSVFLDVDGAMSYATVWLNGKLVGGWPYGYASWRLDLTPFVEPGGANELAIRLDNPPESSRWYPGGGLYRNVWLTVTNSVHVAHWGVSISTPEVSSASAKIAVAVSVDNDSESAAEVDVITRIYTLAGDGTRGDKPVTTISARSVPVAAGSSATVDDTATIRNPRLWGPPPAQSPNRYLAITTLRQAQQDIDRVELPFGIRSLHFDADSGVLVNGERVALQGVNNHHDLGALGAAFNMRAAERQLEILREMGVNAVRMSHNPPAPELLELTDRMGFMVVDEIFDAWYRQKTAQDFHLIFGNWHEPDLRAFLRRDRNHPSVILWSIGNEVGEQLSGEEGAAVARTLVAIAHEEDATRPVTTAMNWASADSPLAATVDVISLNYQGVGIRSLPSAFPAFHNRFPHKLIFSSESAAALSSRGEFQFPVSGSSSGPVRPGVGGDPATMQVSAYEIYAADFGASADKSFAMHEQHPYVAGEFVWSGFDYLGEPTPYYSARSSYYGVVDLAGFKKDRFYLYQSQWRPQLPMAHILPHWTWPERLGEVTPVHVFTSGDEAELFVNGKSQGRQKKAPYQYRLRWDYVVYEPGELRVVAYRDGREWASSTVRTAAEPSQLELIADRSTIRADGLDLAFLTLRIADAHGTTAPRADKLVRFSIEGPGRIVATDNGDATSFMPFGSTERRAFNGLVLAIVSGIPGQPGTILVRAEADGVQSTALELSSLN